MKIGLIYGGNYEESEISKISSENIKQTIISLGHDVIEIDAGENFLENIIKYKNNIEIVFNGMYGKFGEDGRLPAILDKLEIPYTGSGVLGSAIGMNKIISKKIFENLGLKTAKSIKISKEEILNNTWREKVEQKLDITKNLFIKPSESGSSRGIYKIHNLKNFEYKFETKDQYFIAEEGIIGSEYQVAILENKAIGCNKVEYNSDFFDFNTKYYDNTIQHIKADLSTNTIQNLLKMAEKIHHELFLKCYSRIDFIVTTEEEIFALEANSHPGLTRVSNFPDICRMHQNIDFTKMIEIIIKNASYETQTC